MKLTLLFFFISLVLCEVKEGGKECYQPTFQQLTTAFSNHSINRPIFHFTPKTGWMNDPNGLWIDSTNDNLVYHLYFQYNPADTVWSLPLFWGHAKSSDLLNWEEIGIAFGTHDEISGAYSGSIFIDDQKQYGLFSQPDKKNVIAAFTYNEAEGGRETQYLYYSYGGDEFFYKEELKEVVTHDEDNKLFAAQFRDPQVIKIWHNDKEALIMSVAKSQEYKIAFYLNTENSLKAENWKEQTNLELEGFLGFQYECPNLIHLKNSEKNETQYTTEENSYWVLFISINPGSINGGSSTWYLIGQFGLNGDKYKFTPTYHYPAPLDYGKDFYAMQIFYQVRSEDELKNGANEAYGIAWASNWQYTASVPTDPWRSSMSLARKISLSHFAANSESTLLFIKSTPVKDFGTSFTTNSLVTETEKNVTKTDIFTKTWNEPIGSFQFKITFSITDSTGFSKSSPGLLDIYFYCQDDSEYLRLGYEAEAQAFYLDRSHSNVQWVHDNPYFSDKISVNLKPSKAIKDTFIVEGFIDMNIIELFFNDYYQTMTNSFFFTGGNFFNKVEIKTELGVWKVSVNIDGISKK